MRIRYCPHCDAYTVDDGDYCSVCGKYKFGRKTFDDDSNRVQERIHSFMFPLKIRTEDREIKLYDARYRGEKCYAKFVEPNGHVQYDIVDEYALEEGIDSPLSLRKGSIGRGKFRYGQEEPVDVSYTIDEAMIFDLNRRTRRR